MTYRSWWQSSYSLNRYYHKLNIKAYWSKSQSQDSQHWFCVTWHTPSVLKSTSNFSSLLLQFQDPFFWFLPLPLLLFHSSNNLRLGFCLHFCFTISSTSTPRQSLFLLTARSTTAALTTLAKMQGGKRQLSSLMQTQRCTSLRAEIPRKQRFRSKYSPETLHQHSSIFTGILVFTSRFLLRNQIYIQEIAFQPQTMLYSYFI